MEITGRTARASPGSSPTSDSKRGLTRWNRTLENGDLILKSLIETKWDTRSFRKWIVSPKGWGFRKSVNYFFIFVSLVFHFFFSFFFRFSRSSSYAAVRISNSRSLVIAFNSGRRNTRSPLNCFWTLLLLHCCTYIHLYVSYSYSSFKCCVPRNRSGCSKIQVQGLPD